MLRATYDLINELERTGYNVVSLEWKEGKEWITVIDLLTERCISFSNNSYDIKNAVKKINHNIQLMEALK